MAEVLVQLTAAFDADDGRSYVPRICGREREDGLWEGWIEFEPLGGGGGAPLRSHRETTQPNREDLVYWATGLTAAYMEGALERTLGRRFPHSAPTAVPRPAYDTPAPEPLARAARAAPPRIQPTAVLDPFAVHAQGGEDLLRTELSALDAAHLRSIILAHGLHEGSAAEMEKAALAELIVAAVRPRAG